MRNKTNFMNTKSGMENKRPRTPACSNRLGSNEMTCAPYSRKLNTKTSSGKFEEDQDVPLELIIQIPLKIVNASPRD